MSFELSAYICVSCMQKKPINEYVWDGDTRRRTCKLCENVLNETGAEDAYTNDALINREELDDAQTQNVWSNTVSRLLTSITYPEIKNMTPKERIHAAAQAHDRTQLMKGRPTEITEIRDVKKIDEMIDMVHAEIERRAQEEAKIKDITPHVNALILHE